MPASPYSFLYLPQTYQHRPFLSLTNEHRPKHGESSIHDGSTAWPTPCRCPLQRPYHMEIWADCVQQQLGVGDTTDHRLKAAPTPVGIPFRDGGWCS